MDKKKSEKKAAATRSSSKGKTSSVSAGEGTPQEELGTSQLKIDSMLPQASKESDKEEVTIEDVLKLFDTVDQKINKLASKDYIDKSMKKLVKEEFVNEKLESLRSELSKEIKTELDSVRNQVKKVKEKIQDAISEVVAEVDELKDANEAVQVKLEEVIEENKKISKKNDDLQEIVKQRDIRLKVHEKYINDLEQYTRRNSVRIYGLDDKDRAETMEETCKKVVKTLNSKLSVGFLPSDIDIVHRLGKFDPKANRPVICKFVSRFTKIRILKIRRRLKGSSIVIREDLTTKNAKLLETLSAREEISNVWSDEGKIIGLLLDGRKLRFDICTDISEPLIPKDKLAQLLAAKKSRS